MRECLRNHGASVSEEDRHRGPSPFLLPNFDEVGFNYRMTDLQAAVGLVQLAKLDGFVDETATLGGVVREELEAISWLRRHVVPEGYGHAWQSFVTVVEGRRARAAKRPHGEARGARYQHPARAPTR